MRLFIVTLLNLITLTLFAQSKTEFMVTLRDGNIVTGTAKVTEINLITPYGKLTLPIKNVTSIELGIHTDLTQKEKINTLAKQLLNSTEEIRSKAFNELISLPIGAIPVLDEIVIYGNYEPSEYSDYTLTAALNELKIAHGVVSFKSNDEVLIDFEYKMGGEYSFQNLELKTLYGTLTIPQEKILKIDVNYMEESANTTKSFKLIAATHITSNSNGGWLKTGISVKVGQRIIINSTGEVSLASLSGNKYKPDGSTKNSTSNDYVDNSTTTTYPSYGNVVFKIGENGASVKAGANYNAPATQSGVIYISIYETVYNASNSGYYTTNVQIK